MNHAWVRLRETNFGAPERSGHEAFKGVATLHAYAGEDKRLIYGVEINFEGLTRGEECNLMITASGAVADAIVKAAGFRGTCRLSGSTFLGTDLGSPIGDSGDVAKQRASGVWTLSFVRRR